MHESRKLIRGIHYRGAVISMKNTVGLCAPYKQPIQIHDILII
jgi:hypothetical protein